MNKLKLRSIWTHCASFPQVLLAIECNTFISVYKCYNIYKSKITFILEHHITLWFIAVLMNCVILWFVDELMMYTILWLVDVLVMYVTFEKLE